MMKATKIDSNHAFKMCPTVVGRHVSHGATSITLYCVVHCVAKYDTSYLGVPSSKHNEYRYFLNISRTNTIETCGFHDSKAECMESTTNSSKLS